MGVHICNIFSSIYTAVALKERGKGVQTTSLRTDAVYDYHIRPYYIHSVISAYPLTFTSGGSPTFTPSTLSSLGFLLVLFVQ